MANIGETIEEIEVIPITLPAEPAITPAEVPVEAPVEEPVPV